MRALHYNAASEAVPVWLGERHDTVVNGVERSVCDTIPDGALEFEFTASNCRRPTTSPSKSNSTLYFRALTGERPECAP